MAVVNVDSTQLAAQEAQNLEVPEHGRIRALSFDFDQGSVAGDATSVQGLIKLPSGRIRVLAAVSQIDFSAFGAARTLDVGFAAYTDADGATVAADPNYFASAVDVSSAGSLNMNESGTPAASQLLESRNGIEVQAVVAAGTIPASATLKGYLLYVQA